MFVSFFCTFPHTCRYEITDTSISAELMCEGHHKALHSIVEFSLLILHKKGIFTFLMFS